MKSIHRSSALCTLGLALVLVLSACDQAAVSPSSDAGVAAPPSESLVLTDESGTVLGEVLLPASVDLSAHEQIVERDGKYTLVITDEMAAQAASAERGGGNSPPSVHGNYCLNSIDFFGEPTGLVICDRINAVDTPGSGPQGRFDTESTFNGETTREYNDAPGCMEVVTPGPFPPQPVPGDILVVSAEYEASVVFEGGVPQRFYYPDGTVGAATFVSFSPETFEPGCEANGFASFATVAAPILKTLPGFALTPLEGGRLRVNP